MKLKDLQTVDSTLVPVDATWTAEDGEEVEASFFVRRAPHAEFERVIRQAEERDDLSRDCLIICACIRLGDKGQESIPYETAELLPSSTVLAFKDQIDKVYQMGKPSRPSKSSGASLSQQESAGEPSQKQKSG